MGIHLFQMAQSERIEIALAVGGGLLVFFIINRINKLKINKGKTYDRG